MNIVVIFINIGTYHAARLRAFNAMCQQSHWTMTAIQLTDDFLDHPWGKLNDLIDFPIVTLKAQKASNATTTKKTTQRELFRLLSQCLAALKPDVMVIPGWGYPISRAAIRWSTRHHVPAVLMSESKSDDTPRIWWKEKLKSFFYIRHFKSALVGGNLHRHYLVQLGMPKNAVFLGYDVVDNDYFTRYSHQARQNSQLTRQQQAQIPHRPYFIAVTRLIPRKNVTRMIAAFAQYRQIVPAEKAWDLVICGNGPEREKIENHIQSYGLATSIHLPGFQTYQSIPQWFGLASAFIHPALSEQWGLVVNESLASKLPALVSNRCGCYPELIVEGVNGFGFDPENVHQLATLMTKVSSGEIDLNQMQEAALTHIQKFSPQIFARGLTQAINCALKNNE
ncbi:MAG: glycosyltransferase [Phormidesmis sp. RL_2_1]|nr:glycosyltransferase [Phormidesmis sp. RL_2_1]